MFFSSILLSKNPPACGSIYEHDFFFYYWRRRVRIELTRRGIATAQTGFEVQATHQDRSASNRIALGVYYLHWFLSNFIPLQGGSFMVEQMQPASFILFQAGKQLLMMLFVMFIFFIALSIPSTPA